MRDATILQKLKRGNPKGLELLMKAYLPYVSVIVWNILQGSMARRMRRRWSPTCSWPPGTRQMTW